MKILKNRMISILLILVLLISIAPMGLARPENNRKEAGILTRGNNESNIKNNEARENYVLATEKYKEAQEKRKNLWQEIKDSKKQLQQCIEDNSAECEKVRNEVKDKTKQFLGKSIEAILSVLERVKARILGNDKLTNDEKTEMITALDQKINEVEKAQLLLANATTGQQIKDIAKMINAAWKNSKEELDKDTHKLAIVRLEKVIDEFGAQSDKIKKRIDNLVAKGMGVTELNTLLSDYNNKVNDAKNKLNELIKDVEAGDYKAANSSFQETKSILKEAHGILKELLQKIKEANKELNTENKTGEKNE